MRVLAVVLFVLSTALAYQVTSPNEDSGWTTTGPNVLQWDRVSTDPQHFAVFLTSMQNFSNSELLSASVDGTQGSVVCSPPTGGWPSGDGFRVNLAQDGDHPDSLLAQSSEFNITAASSNQSTTATASSSRTGTGTATVTSASSSVSGSNTNTTPTGTSAALLSADVRTGVLSAVVALTAMLTSLF